MSPCPLQRPAAGLLAVVAPELASPACRTVVLGGTALIVVRAKPLAPPQSRATMAATV